MATFFCSNTPLAFQACFPNADTLEFFLVDGGYARLRSDLLSSICIALKKERIPFSRVLHAHAADRTVAVYLPTYSRIAADSIYFSEIQSIYAKQIQFTLCTEEFCAQGAENCIKEELLSLRDLEIQAYTRAERLFTAAAVFKQENAALISSYQNKAKMLHSVFRFLKRHAETGLSAARAGRITRDCRCSALTEWGVHCCYAPFAAVNLQTVLLKDLFGGVTKPFLNGLAAACQECGCDVQIYRCALDETPEHLVIPSLSTAFFTENAAHIFPYRPAAILPAGKFTDLTALQHIRSELRFNTASADALLEEAAFSLYESGEALRAQDRLWEQITDPARIQAGKALLCAQIRRSRQNDENYL